MKKILLVDDFDMIREAFKDYLEDQKQFKVACEASNGEEALIELQNNDIDLLITDISMPKMTGIELIKQANQLYPQTKVLVLTMYHDQQIVQECLQLKIQGYMVKNSERAKVIKAIELIINGGEFWDMEIEALKLLKNGTAN